MELRLRIIRDAYQSYSNSVYSMVFLLIALVYMLIRYKRKEKELLLYEIFGMLLLTMPVVANRLMTMGGDYGYHWLLYAILCAAIVIAYAGTEVLSETLKKREKLLVVICFMIALQFSKGFAYSTDSLMLLSNFAKASEETVIMSERLEDVEEPVVIAPKEIASELKRYNNSLKVAYGKDVSYDSDNLRQFLLAAENYNCNCMIVALEVDDEQIMNEAGFYTLQVTENYKLYTR